LAGKRSGLFFEIVRLVEEIRPAFVFLENVRNIRTKGADTVVQEFSRLRYDCRWGVLSAADVGANHKRERWWLLAHAQSKQDRRIQSGRFLPDSSAKDHLESSRCEYGKGSFKQRADGIQAKKQNADQSERSSTVADVDGQHGEELLRGNKLEEKAGEKTSGWRDPFDRRFWECEPDVGRVAHGVPFRVDRLRGLGNAVVPLQAREAFERLMGLKRL
jgi:DNA (cytosine-5)-methyltransferase 1